MKLLILSVAIVIIIFSIRNIKNGKVNASNMSKKNTQTDKNEPVNFGYKNAWIAVKSNDKQGISKIIGLKNTKPENWYNGISISYENGVYITPQIGEWTLVVGMELVPSGSNIESINKLEKILNKLSSEYGEAHFFGTHRVVEYHCWMKSTSGKMKRIYSYIGESGENIKVYGEPTNVEKDLKLFNSLSEEAKSNDYWNREDLVYPDEMLVMKIAENWSVNPTKLIERKDIVDEFGLFGTLKYKD